MTKIIWGLIVLNTIGLFVFIIAFFAMRRHIGIFNRCPLKYIASYIGTSQLILRRIRAGVQ